MKKKILFVILLFFIPVFVSAKSYEISETDVTLDLDSDWLVFTRDNIKDNKKLEELEISYEYMNEFFLNNPKVYADILKLNDDYFIEFFVKKAQVDDVTNLSLFTDEEVLDFAKEMSNQIGTDNYYAYNSKDYKFVYWNCISEGLYLQEYVTIVNNDMYVFTFQKNVEFNDNDKDDLKKVIDNISFNVKVREDKKDPIVESVGGSRLSVAFKAIIGALVGGVVGGICGFIFYTLKKKKNNSDKSNIDNNGNNKK